MLIGNMALADLLTTMFAMTYSMVYLYVQNQWFGGVAGEITCKLILFPFTVSIAASVITILVISVGRFLAVFYPLRGKIMRKPKLMTTVIWGVSVLTACPTVYPYQVVQPPPGGQFYCVVLWPGGIEATDKIQQIYYLLLFILLYSIPLALTSMIYLAIGWRLWKRQIPGYDLDANRRAASKTKKKVVKMLIIIVIIFAICWAPAHAMHYFMYEPEFPSIPIWVKVFSFWLAHANSAINPFLYIVLNDSFRKEFNDIVGSCNVAKLWRRSSSYLTSSTAIKTTGSTMVSSAKSSRSSWIRKLNRNRESSKGLGANYGGTSEEPAVQLLKMIVTSEDCDNQPEKQAFL